MWMCFGVAKTAGYVYFRALSADGFHSLHGLQFADEQPQLQVVLDEDGELSVEESVTAFYINIAEHDVLVLGDDGGEIVDDAEVVVPDDVDDCGKGVLAASACPACSDNAVGEALNEFGGIRTVVAMDFDASSCGDKSEDGVSEDR